jgi:phosphoenolpyruvate synthase/pyruvate phosphate dikinase
MSERYVLGFGEIDATRVALAGGKGANLASSHGSRVSPCRRASA